MAERLGQRVWPLLRALSEISERNWKEASPHEHTPTTASYAVDTSTLEQRIPYQEKPSFPDDRNEFFLLPPLPEEDFVGYLAFEWQEGQELAGSYHVYLIHKEAIVKSRAGDLKQPIAAYVVRYETANESHYMFSHAQGCCNKKGTHYPGAIDFLPRTIVPKSLPHLPLHTCQTPSGFLLTLIAGLYGTEGEPFKRLAQEDLSDEELKLAKELREGMKTKDDKS